MLDVDALADSCDDPVMVVALTGWVDGGLAGAGAVAAAAEAARVAAHVRAASTSPICWTSSRPGRRCTSSTA